MSAQAVEPVLDRAVLETALRAVLQQDDDYRIAGPLRVCPTGDGLHMVVVAVGLAGMVPHLTAVTS